MADKLKLRVLNIINIGSGRIDYYDVDSVREAEVLINTLADIQLKSPEIESNAFGLEEFIDGDWWLKSVENEMFLKICYK